MFEDFIINLRASNYDMTKMTETYENTLILDYYAMRGVQRYETYMQYIYQERRK